ncbi:MAG TPA: ABC transporter ATP-binding protein [Chloroflexota bacterium]|jgi:ABC-2 type transport system ATP-binding protein
MLPDATPMIEAVDLQRSFGDRVAVKGISLEVSPGELFGFLGPNGAGKTTTIKMLIGVLRPSAGQARIGGYDVQREPQAAKRLLGYVPAEPDLPGRMNAREYLDYVAGLYRVPPADARRRAEEWLHVFDLVDQADDLVDGYSHGMRQKMMLAGALLHQPKALFLDEPTVGLDPHGARQVKDILRELTARGAAVFLTTHIMEIAERMCDRIAIVDHGELVALGTMDELRRGATTTLEDLFLALTGGHADAAIAAALG